MVEINPVAKYNRTLGGPYDGYDIMFAPAEELEKLQQGLPSAYTIQGQSLIWIKYRKDPNRDFKKYATDWEIFHSKVPFGEGSGTCFPVIDDERVVIGHYGTFTWEQIFIPAEYKDAVRVEEVPVTGTLGLPRAWEVKKRPPGLNELVEFGADVVVDRYQEYYLKRGYIRYFAPPQQWYTVITDIEGHVLLVLSTGNSDGIEPSAFSPLDLILVVKLVVVGLAAAGALVLRTYVRRRAVRAALESGGREAARRVGRITAREMEQHLDAVLRARPDLRRLMAARVMTGEGRMKAIKIALKEFEDTQHWKVVEKTAAEMEAVTTRDNIVTLRADRRELWINKDRAARWDPEDFYEHVVHDLGAHALAGRGGTLTAADIPFVGDEFRRGITDALALLERTIRREGVTGWISRTFGGE